MREGSFRASCLRLHELRSLNLVGFGLSALLVCLQRAAISCLYRIEVKILKRRVTAKANG
jgi:hypothetical protein